MANESGFRLRLKEADKAARTSLPAAAAAIEHPVKALTDHVDASGHGRSAAATSAFQHCTWLADHVASRQAHAAQVVRDTADALAAIIDVYRQADGQA